VQCDRLPDRSNPVFVHPVVTQELCCGIGPVHFKPLIAVGVLGDSEVVQDAAQEYQLVVVLDVAPKSLGGGPFAAEQVTAHAVIGHERRRHVEYEFHCGRTDSR
jgi:hypothetical protein